MSSTLSCSGSFSCVPNAATREVSRALDPLTRLMDVQVAHQIAGLTSAVAAGRLSTVSAVAVLSSGSFLGQRK